ncbi:MAG TPA: hypothetical protein VII02_01455 [Gemmatimonadaceae bacterium]
MPKLSPYRSLSVDRRVMLVTHAMQASREGRDLFIQRLVARGGGFRAVALKAWPTDRLAREIVRMKAESASDELDLLQLLYVDLDPSIQTTFLEAAGVAHDGGKIPEALEPPYADADAVRRGAAAVQERHGADGVHYLRTISRYSLSAWPGVDAIVAELDG